MHTYIAAILLEIVIVLAMYLLIDYVGDRRITLRIDKSFGFVCFRAKDLIVQEFDEAGNLWATRGLLLYKLENGGHEFHKIARIPTGNSVFWLNNFSLFRRLTLRPECAEITIAQNGSICSFSCGKMWIGKKSEGRLKRTLSLKHFGRKIGRGIMSTGLLKINNNSFYFGEYFSNPERTNVDIYKYCPSNNSWEAAYEFQAGQIRHVHALQRDPYSGRLWICTGDEDNEAMIGWSDNYYKTIEPIGRGSQIWRACQLVFTEEAVYWGTDTGSIDLAGIYNGTR
jgi:hypothetical protein